MEGWVGDPGDEGCEGQSWECPQPVLDGKSFRNGEEEFRVRGGNEGLGFDYRGALAGSAPRWPQVMCSLLLCLSLLRSKKHFPDGVGARPGAW